MILSMGDALSRVNVSRSAAELEALRANQGICNQAASALARQSPAYPGLAAQCLAARQRNVAARVYYVDQLTPDDASYRVALTNAGEAVIAGDLALQAARAAIPVDPDGDQQQRRGFTIAQGVRAGSLDPNFPTWVVAGLSRNPLLLKGFQDAMAGRSMPDLTQARQPEEDAADGIPRPVLIGGGIAAALALGLVAYKLTR